MPPRNLTILSLAGMVAVSPLLNAGDNAPEELARLKQILAAAEYIVVSQLGDPPDPGWCRREHCLLYRRIVSQHVLEAAERKRVAHELWRWAEADPPSQLIVFGPASFHVYIEAGQDVLVLEGAGDPSAVSLTALLNRALTPLAGFEGPPSAFRQLLRWSHQVPRRPD